MTIFSTKFWSAYEFHCIFWLLPCHIERSNRSGCDNHSSWFTEFHIRLLFVIVSTCWCGIENYSMSSIWCWMAFVFVLSKQNFYLLNVTKLPLFAEKWCKKNHANNFTSTNQANGNKLMEEKMMRIKCRIWKFIVCLVKIVDDY